MNSLLAILKVTDARRDVILAGELNHRFPWRQLQQHRKADKLLNVFDYIYII